MEDVALDPVDMQAAGIPDSALIESTMDDLFGDVNLSPPPFPASLRQRIDHMQTWGCCT